MTGDRVCISVVSHRQALLVKNLLEDLAKHCQNTIEVILTLNVDEPLPFKITDFGFPVELKQNTSPHGFGANHNAAFGSCKRKTFCVLNPDILLTANPFPALLDELARERIGVVAPRILDANGHTEDNARRFPTLRSLGAKALRLADRLDYEIGASALSPDWVAGMFMVFTADAYRAVAGFDERYYLYYEDVDICARLRAAGYDVRLVPSAFAVHHARRASHHRWLHRAWHFRSIVRYLLTKGP